MTIGEGRATFTIMDLPLSNWSALALITVLCAAPAAVIVALATSRRLRDILRRR